ncbi:MAG: ABC transporter permease [Candidatus Eremiobacteraeota bacterium]|nr:ABC transporter permease [Candidatus Eremiobacteraeota bacterium]MBV8282984.1 ABC transporter permease [Candidatus Eremiobacteraeota bacterium]
MNPAQALWAYAASNQPALAHAVWTHLGLSLSALAVACALSIPLGIWTSRHPAGASVIAVMNALRSVPSLAVLALVLPVLGLGPRPALVALTLLAIPPILINTDVGLRGVDPGAIEAAVGMGMHPRQVLARVQAPLAAPVVLAGVRTAAVEVIASATLAAFIGGGGLGDLIVAGLQTDDIGELLAGAISVALLALLAEALLGLTQRRLTAPAQAA